MPLSSTSSTSPPTSSSDDGLQFSISAPTPLAEAWAFVRNPQGSAQERLTRRFELVEQTLYVLVAVLDAERASLGLPPPAQREALVRRLDSPTLGQLVQAMNALGRVVAQSPDSALRELALVVAPDTPPDPFGSAMGKLIELRNRTTHDHHGHPPEEQARRHLDESRPWLRALLIALEPLCRAPIVLLDSLSDRVDGGSEAQVLVFQGTEPRLLHTTRHLPLRRRQPALLTERGVVVNLSPWICYGDFGESRVPHLRVLRRWTPEGPGYARSGYLGVGHLPELRQPHNRAAEVLDGSPPLPRAPNEALAELWRRVLTREEGTQLPQIPGYQIERTLGRGASGTVWLAREEDSGRAVALKVLHPALAQRSLDRARLSREHAALRLVTHPGVARVYDFLESSPAGPVLVMEPVSGRPLSELVAERPMDPTSAARLCGQVLDALGAIHAHGLVHRDVKPSNILVEHGHPRLVDFGVARAGDTSTLTGTLDVVGTRLFAAPEQLAGKEVDGRADLYSVGRMLPLLCSLEGEWGTRLGRLPGALQCIVRRATQEDPGQRYRSAAAMQRELEARQIEGWAGPPVGVGDVLPGGLRLVKQLDEIIQEVWLFLAQPLASAGQVAILVAGPRNRAELEGRLKAAVPSLLQDARCNGARVSEDGLLYAELRADEPMVWSRRLLGLEVRQESAWNDQTKLGAAITGVAALVGAAASTYGIHLLLRDLKKRAPGGKPSSPPALKRDEIAQRAQLAGLFLHALAHAGGEARVDEKLWARLCAKALEAPLRVLGDEGDCWGGKVGAGLAVMSDRRQERMELAALALSAPNAAQLSRAHEATSGLEQALDRVLASWTVPGAPPYARRSAEGWEMLVIGEGKRGWILVR